MMLVENTPKVGISGKDLLSEPNRFLQTRITYATRVSILSLITPRKLTPSSLTVTTKSSTSSVIRNGLPSPASESVCNQPRESPMFSLYSLTSMRKQQPFPFNFLCSYCFVDDTLISVGRTVNSFSGGLNTFVNFAFRLFSDDDIQKLIVTYANDSSKGWELGQ